MNSVVNEASPQTLGIRSCRHLAAILGINVEVLRLLVRDRAFLYSDREKWDKKRRKFINIEEPQGRLKEVQQRLAKRLIDAVVVDDPIAYGSVRGRSPLLAARLHTNKALVVTIDICDFYGHVTFEHVHNTLTQLRCSPRVAEIIAKLTTRNGHLPKGAPSSPAISNLVMLRFDRKMNEEARALGVSICRYIDDIAVSGPQDGVCKLVGRCIRCLHALGLPVHRQRKVIDGKRPKLCFQKRGGFQEVLSLNVSGKAPVVPRAYGDTVRSEIRQKSRFGATDRETASIRGKIAYLRSTSPNRAARLERQLNPRCDELGR